MIFHLFKDDYVRKDVGLGLSLRYDKTSQFFFFMYEKELSTISVKVGMCRGRGLKF